MKVFITGANGFTGRNLSEQLNNRYALSALNRQELDLLDAQKVLGYLKAHRFDAVIHTATYDAAPKHSTKDPAKVLENNLRMFFNLARGQDYFGKMIYFGSGAEFDKPHWKPRMKEEYFDQYLPQDQYGFSKYVMTKYAQVSSNIYNLRLFGVFGKYDDWRTRFISNACCNAVLGEPIVIKQNVTFDYLYIDDLVNLIRWFIENQPVEKIYNVCTAHTFDHLTLAKKIVQLSAKDIEIIIKDKNARIEYSGDNSRLMSEIGGYNFIDMDEALGKLYSWYLENKESINLDALKRSVLC